MRTTRPRRMTWIAVGVAILTLASTAVARGATPGGPVSDRVLDPTGQVLIGDNTPPVSPITGINCSTDEGGCDLYAKTGSVAIPGGSVPIWGYATTPGGPAELPGPTIVADEADQLTIRVHNGLSVATSLSLPAVPADAVLSDAPSDGFGSGGTATYTFAAAEAVGTSVYEAGVTATGNRQVAMGMAGVLVVRPTSCPESDPVTYCLYPDDLVDSAAATNDTDEETLVALNDLDPAFAADPLGYEMSAFAPSVHLINGRAFPQTDVIDTQPGHTVGVRLANLSPIAHTMGVIGAHQTIVGRDARQVAHDRVVASPLITSGQTIDASIAVPADAVAGQRYPLFDQGLQLDNPGTDGFGGALAFLNVWGPEGVPGVPVAKLDPFAYDVTPGTDLPFSGTALGATGFRWYVDAAPEDPAALTPSAEGIEPATGFFLDTVPADLLATLANGSHVIWVQLTNAADPSAPDAPWGQPVGVAFTLDRSGPVMSGTSIEPVTSNKTVPLTLRTTADTDVTGGTANITSGHYGFDSDCVAAESGPLMGADPGAPGTALPGQQTQGLQATIAGPELAALSEGEHTIYVTAQDEFGHWPASNPFVLPGSADPVEYATAPMCDSVTFNIDNHAPTVSNASVEPTPTNGKQPIDGGTNFLDSVRLKVTITDPAFGDPVAVSSPIDTAEAFIEGVQIDGNGDPVPFPSGAVTGKGIELLPLDGAFDSDVEVAYILVPLATVRSLTPGAHHIWIHGKDAAGNWGAIAGTGDAVLDYEPDAPTINYLKVGATTIDVGATAVRTDLTVTSIEYSVGTAPGTWSPLTLTTTSGPVATVSAFPIPARAADQNVFVRATDSLGHVSAPMGLPTIGATFRLSPQLFTQGDQLAADVVSMTGDISSVEFKVAPFATLPSADGWTAIPDAVGPSPLTAVLPDALRQVQVGQTVWLRAKDVQGNLGPVFGLPAVTSLTRTNSSLSGVAQARQGTVGSIEWNRTLSSSTTAPQLLWSSVSSSAAGPSPRSFSRSLTIIDRFFRIWVRAGDGLGNAGPAVRAPG